MPESSLRLLGLKEVPQMIRVERLAWSDLSTGEEILKKRILDPSVSSLGIFEGDRLMAFGQVRWMTMRSVLSDVNCWNDIAQYNSGGIGEIAFGFNLASSGGGEGSKKSFAEQVINGLFALVVSRQGRAFAAGGRIPGFHKWCHRLPADHYYRCLRYKDQIFLTNRDSGAKWLGELKLWEGGRDGISESEVPDYRNISMRRLLRDGRYLDPFVRLLTRVHCGGQDIKMHGVCPNFFDDPASRNFGLVYSWSNPFAEHSDDNFEYSLRESFTQA